jgi:hypothetical protein
MEFLLKLLLAYGVDCPKSLYLLQKQCPKHTAASSIVLNNGQFSYLSIFENLLFLIKKNFK